MIRRQLRRVRSERFSGEGAVGDRRVGATALAARAAVDLAKKGDAKKSASERRNHEARGFLANNPTAWVRGLRRGVWVSENSVQATREFRTGELLRIPLPRTRVNKAATSLPAGRRREDLSLNADTVRPYAARRNSVWDALQPHAPVALAVGLPVGVAADACKLCLAAR